MEQQHDLRDGRSQTSSCTNWHNDEDGPCVNRDGGWAWGQYENHSHLQSLQGAIQGLEH